MRRLRELLPVRRDGGVSLDQPILADQILKRDVAPLEGTNMSLFNSIIPSWWSENGLLASNQWMPGDGMLSERVWISNRCIQMNAQQIASMPLRFESPNVASDGEPAWVSSPDPAYFPNGIGDAVHAIVRDVYAWGYAICFVTNRYYNGFPRNWTVLPASQVDVRFDQDRRRVFKVGEIFLNPGDVVQIDRNPGCGAHGTSAIQAYAQLAWGLLAAGNTAMDVNQGGVPKAVIKSQRKLTQDQAEAIQTQWMARTQARNGAPPVLPPELDFEALSFSPRDMALLETQDFNALALAAAFGVPAELLNMAIRYTGLTYNNVGSVGERWWRFELRTTAKRIADAFSAQMLPAGQWVWFDATDTFLPLSNDTVGPFASDNDDTEAAAVAKDTQAEPPAVANASPAQQPAQQPRRPRLTAIGGPG